MTVRSFAVVIPSANAAKLIECVRAIRRHEPSLDPSRIIVVDDGARAGAGSELPDVRWVEGVRPFVFATNANLGIAAAGGDDVVLLNDDARLVTSGGFTALAAHVDRQPSLGLVAAAVRGAVGNRAQRPRASGGLRAERSKLCFVCVYIPRSVYGAVGPLDERFVGYGYEDDDYSLRVRERGFELGIADDCVVEHDGGATFRTCLDYVELEQLNRRLYLEKQDRLRGAERFVLAMRVKNGVPFVGEAIERAMSLCDRALIFDDHSDDGTAAICRALGPRVTVVESPFEGLDEARDKNEMLRLLRWELPDWVLWIDADEVLERSGPQLLREATRRDPFAAAFALRVAYVWDDPEQVRVDGIFGRFHRESLFRMRGQSVERLQFRERGSGPNLHCGNVPMNLAGHRRRLGVRLRHYGYMTAEQRQRKYDWYVHVDPDNAAEDHYRHIAGERGARYAPGPPRFVRWTEGR